MKIPATLTPCTDQQLVAALRGAYLAQLGIAPRDSTAAVLLAQVALETGHGARVVQWNVGNFKRGLTTDWCSFATTEILGGVTQHMTCDFSAWPDLQSGVSDWIRALYTHWPEAWAAAVAGDSAAFAHGLRERGYYTAAEADYAAGLATWQRHYLRLLAEQPEPPRVDEVPGLSPAVVLPSEILDPGLDPGRDAGRDAVPDPGIDPGPDPDRDAGIDPGPDAGPDAGLDPDRDAP